jgi:hypothetical protein
MLIQSIVHPLSTFRFGEPILPIVQRLECIVDDYHTNVVAWKDVFVFSHGIVRPIHKVGQKVPRDIVGLVGFDPRFIHKFPSDKEAEYQQAEGNAKEIDSRLHNTIVLVLSEFDDKFSQGVKSAVDVGWVGVERFLRVVTSVHLISRLRAYVTPS